MNDSAAPISRRADAYAVLFALVFPTLVTLLYFIVLADRRPIVQHAAYGPGKAIQFVFPVVWVLAVQRRGVRLRLPGRAGLAESIGFGVLVFAAMLLMYHWWLKPVGYLDAAAGEIRQKIEGFGVDTLLKYIFLGTAYSLVHSLAEEYYWRWFVFGQLRRLISLWPAMVVSSLGFMAHHVLLLGTFFEWSPLPVVLFSLAVAVGGAVWAWIYHRSDSLYGPWLSHMFVDAGIFTLGYYLAGDLLGA